MLDYIFEYNEFRAGRMARPNPFLRDAKGSIRSLIGISAISLANPDLAKRLCQEAGEPLEKWFPENPL